MIKRFTYLLAGMAAIAAMLPSTVSAQVGKAQLAIEKRLPGQASNLRQQPVEKLFPALKIRPMRADQSPFSLKKHSFIRQKTAKASTQLKAGGYIPSAYAVIGYDSNVSQDSVPYLSNFQLSAPLTFDKIGYTSALLPTNGATISDGKFTGVYFNTAYASYGIIVNYLVSFDLETGEMTEDEDLGSQYNLAAVETAVDPTDGSVFGEFFNSNVSGYEYGVIDYAAKSRTTIASTTRAMVALGVDNSGQPYGIATDGNLYKIDKSTGTETRIGSTGINVADYRGYYYSQTGEIDPKTNTFYWAAVDSSANSALYSVNLQTAAVTPVATGTFELSSLVIPAPEANEGAPGQATDISASFSGPSTTGTITFTAPSAKFDGTSLSGSLNYTITANGAQVATGTTTAGAVTTANVSLTEGVNNIIVTTSNSEGKSPNAKTTVYVGYDQPAAPSNVALAVDAQNNATVTWTAPTTTIHNGYLGDLKYDVYRYANKDTVKVATDLTTTTFTEKISSSALASYSYGVQAKNGTQASATATSNGQIIGSAFEVPYLEEFDDASSLDLFTIIDANNDTHTWSYYEGTARYRYDTYNAGDDWLITPPIRLKAGKTYTVAFKARNNGSTFPEKIEAKWGQGSTVADMTSALAPSTELTGGEWNIISNDITPTADGDYNIGFHAISDANEFYLYLDSVSVTQAADANAPDSVTNLKATADPSGALKVTLTFNAPSKAINGTAISALDSIEVRKGNTVLGTIKPAAPGSAQTFVDDKAVAGTNNYTIIAVNDKGPGRAAKASAYAGPDVPSAPDVTANDNLTSVKLTWPTVTGLNGGIIVPSEVKYDIYDVTDDGDLGNQIGTVTGGNEYDINLNTTEGEQTYKFWAMRASNAAGASQYSEAALVVGAPYTLPFSNSLAGGTLENQFMGLIRSNQSVTWTITTATSYDNDGGAAQFVNGDPDYSTFAGQSSLTTGKISLTGAQHPKLIFNYNGSVTTDGSLIAEIEHKDGSISQVWSENFTTGTGTWKTASIDLPTSVTSEPYIIVHFRGVANSGDYTSIYVDNIHVADPYQNDAAIDVTAPASRVKGQTADIVATLSNQGLDALSNLEVKISVNNKIIADTTIAKSLATFDQVTIPVSYRTTTLDESTSLNVKAEIVNANDLDDSNNSTTASIALTQADVNSPSNLQGTPTGELTWTAPATSFEDVNDNFESYTAWSTSNVGDWTFVNADGGYFGALTQSGADPNHGTAAAWEVWRPGDIFNSGQGLDPHAGDQCLASVFKVDANGRNYVNSDDWAISPQLSGNAQTVSFWVNNVNLQGNSYPETYQVLYSTTDKQTSSFTKIGNDYTQSNGTWTQISVDLPEGSKYFAIRRTSEGESALLLLIDDVKFEAGSGAVSYNVYVDGEFAGNTTDTDFNVTGDGTASHSYSVTAVYSDGSESAPVSIDLIVNGIDGIHTAMPADSYDVYTIGGAQIKHNAKNLSGLRSGVYVINGKKVLVK